MEGCFILIFLVVAVGVLALPFILFDRVRKLDERLTILERKVSRPTRELPSQPAEVVLRPEIKPLPTAGPPAEVMPGSAAPEPPPPPPAAPPLRPPVTQVRVPSPALRVPSVPVPAINFRLEDFLGVKLFAWVGAVLAFLAVSFFIKYSFDNNLVKPPVRVAIGGLVGLCTLGGALRLDRARYRFLVQSLCSAALLIFYGTLYAAHGVYALVPQTPSFLLMILVTLTAFVLAVRLDAIAVAVLGLVGGFLTPPLLSTGVDRPLALFTYVALLDAGLVALAARRRWAWLVPLSVAGTIFLQFGWVAEFLTLETVPVALMIFGFFPLLFGATLLLVRPTSPEGRFAVSAAILPAFISLGFLLCQIGGPNGSAFQSPWPMGLFLLAVEFAIVAPAGFLPQFRSALPVAGFIVFGILAFWIGKFLEPSLLPVLFVFVLAFAGIHGILPWALERRRPGTPGVAGWTHVFVPLALVLILHPVFTLPEGALVLWGLILLLGGAALWMARATGQLLGFAATFALTIVALALAILRIPAPEALPVHLLGLIGGFAGLYFVASWAIARGVSTRPHPLARLLPTLSALLPFLLLILSIARLAVPNPSEIFTLGTLLTVLALVAVARHGADGLFGATYAGFALLELVWHALRFSPDAAGIAAAWYVGIFFLFLGFPFVVRRKLEARPVPWMIAAAAGPVQFVLLDRTAHSAAPDLARGLIALAFAAVYVGALATYARVTSSSTAARDSVLATLGGVALLFLTAVFPLQFDRQWITVGWALEGAALLALHRRIRHEGLRVASLLLLSATFVRLLPGINPFLIGYAERGSVPLLNWFLYTYGIVAVCHFAAGRLVEPEHPKILDLPARAVFSALGTLLLFLLVNLEIADFFSAGDRYLTFRFPASLAQDMTTSIAWAIFAFILLVTGVWQKSRAARYSGMGLLSITLLKVALYDLWQLGGLYRVGSLIGLAIVLLLVSYLYHRWTREPGEASGTRAAEGGA